MNERPLSPPLVIQIYILFLCMQKCLHRVMSLLYHDIHRNVHASYHHLHQMTANYAVSSPACQYYHCHCILSRLEDIADGMCLVGCLLSIHRVLLNG